MKKCFCDLCFEEINEYSENNGKISFYSKNLYCNGEQFEVCPICLDAIHTFLLDWKSSIRSRIKRNLYPALQKGVARDPEPDDMKLQQGRKSPTRKPLAADHPASSHKKKRSFYWTKERHELLTDNFFKKTPEEIMKLLPGVTIEEIQQHAEYSGMVLKKPGDKNGAGPDS